MKSENNEGQISNAYLKTFRWWIMPDEKLYKRDIRYQCCHSFLVCGVSHVLSIDLQKKRDFELHKEKIHCSVEIK